MLFKLMKKMKTSKKLYWSSFALQFALAVFALFKIDNLAYAKSAAYMLGLIWILYWLPVNIKKHRENEQLSRKIVCYIALVIMSLQIATIFFSWEKLIDFFVLLCFNGWLIVDDAIMLRKQKKQGSEGRR